jgi:hypothetical protein
MEGHERMGDGLAVEQHLALNGIDRLPPAVAAGGAKEDREGDEQNRADSSLARPG